MSAEVEFVNLKSLKYCMQQDRDEMGLLQVAKREKQGERQKKKQTTAKENEENEEEKRRTHENKKEEVKRRRKKQMKGKGKEEIDGKEWNI